MSQVAVVILNYNGRDFLSRFLPGLISNCGTARIIVADNCSSDDSLEVLKQFTEVEVIQLPQNYGYAGGYNEALKQVDADYYALVNSDIEVTSSWLQPLVSFLDQNDQYASVQPKILDYHHQDHFEYAGAAGGFLDMLGYPYCRGRIFNHIESDHQQYDHTIDTLWTSGACMLIRSKVFHQLEGFDANFFAHMEEIDLCWRIKSHQMKTACIPSSVVYHVGGGTLHKSSPHKTYLNFRNGISLLIKNLPLIRLAFILPVRIIFDWLAAFLFWKNESFSHFIAVFKGHRDALKCFRNHIRRKHRSKPTLTTEKSIILPVSYYLLGKKEYCRLNNTK